MPADKQVNKALPEKDTATIDSIHFEGVQAIKGTETYAFIIKVILLTNNLFGFCFLENIF